MDYSSHVYVVAGISYLYSVMNYYSNVSYKKNRYQLVKYYTLNSNFNIIFN